MDYNKFEIFNFGRQFRRNNFPAIFDNLMFCAFLVDLGGRSVLTLGSTEHMFYSFPPYPTLCVVLPRSFSGI